MLLSFGRKIGLQIICTTSVYLADYPQTCCNRFRNGHRIFIERMYADLGPNTQFLAIFALFSFFGNFQHGQCYSGKELGYKNKLLFCWFSPSCIYVIV